MRLSPDSLARIIHHDSLASLIEVRLSHAEATYRLGAMLKSAWHDRHEDNKRSAPNRDALLSLREIATSRD
ncbi:MAG: hypothetical protein M3Z54_03260 [Gemmatimonadota bacterium]|nr:hypothetical protein [Gemmatimonadota bacterium]